jgi:hypothetical protein
MGRNEHLGHYPYDDPQLRVYNNPRLDYGDIAGQIDRAIAQQAAIPCGPHDYACDGDGDRPLPCPNHREMRELVGWCVDCDEEKPTTTADTHRCEECAR